MKYQIIPTIISRNQKEFDSLFDKYRKYFKIIQIDIMDGKFVKNKSNWFNLKLNKKCKYEAHLMIDNPEEYIYKNYKKFDVLIANIERIKNPLKLINFAKFKKKKIGFALNPETSLMHITPYLKYLDRVLILTVNPGKYGAKLVPKTLEKINMLRMMYTNDIEVDGHIDLETLKKCKKEGANLFAVGSYFKYSKNIKNSIKELNKII